MLVKVKSVSSRLDKAMEDALGRGWLDSCFQGLPKSDVSIHSVEHNQIIWIHNMIKAFGMLGFAQDRYGSLEGNLKNWDDSLTKDESIDKVGRVGWGFVPGLPYQEDKDFSDDFVNVPDKNKDRVLEAEQFVHTWCSKREEAKASEEGEEKKKPSLDIPEEWKTAVDMRPWPDFPDRPRRD
jgi:hypothetical protein